MTKIIALLIIGCTSVLVTHAQTADSTQKARVEKYIFNAQIGFFSIWAYGEWRLGDRSSLRAELGISTIKGFIVLQPLYFITIAPKWYYNLNRRVRRLKDITENKADFLFLRIGYLPNGISFGSPDITHTIIIVPAWGMRRAISRRINYEIGVGMGVAIVSHSGFFDQSNLRPYPHLRFRLEYRFHFKKEK